MHARPLKTLMIFCIVLSALFLPVSCGQVTNEPKFDILPALKGLKLSGRLLFIALGGDGSQTGNQIVELDLSSGKTHVLFSGAPKSWLNAAEVSPDGKQVLLAYAPPPAAGETNYGFTDLDLMPVAGGKAPTPLLVRFYKNDAYYYPTWTPDGTSIYFTHNAQDTTAASGIKTRIERAIPGKEPQPLIDHAYWPRLSPDGTKLVYHSLKPEDFDDDLYIANADGSDPRRVIQSNIPVIIDAMLFSPDGKSLYLSMAQSQSFQQPPTVDTWPRFRWSFGVQPVSAHNLPEDWYRVSLEGGGQKQQISHLADIGMFATFSPDGQWFVVVSRKGIIVMKPDGSQATQIANIPVYGSVNWVK